MTLLEQFHQAKKADHESDLRVYAELISRSHDPHADDGRELMGVARRLGMDEATIEIDQAQHLSAVVEREALRRRRASYASLLEDREMRRTSSKSITGEPANNALEKLLYRASLGKNPLVPLVYQTHSDFMFSVGCKMPAFIGWIDANGISVTPDTVIHDEFRRAYEPIAAACEEWLKVSEAESIPEDPSDEQIAALKAKVDALDPPDQHAMEVSAIVVGGFQIFVKPVGGETQREIQKRVADYLSRVHVGLLSRADARRRSAHLTEGI